jgi:hypothetical protein
MNNAAEAKEPPVCEAQEALMKLAFELELQWGAGLIDVGKLKALATGATCTHQQKAAA